MRSPAPGGLEGCKPSKNHPFRVVVAGKAGNDHAKNGDLGEAEPPQTPPPHISCELNMKASGLGRSQCSISTRPAQSRSGRLGFDSARDRARPGGMRRCRSCSGTNSMRCTPPWLSTISSISPTTAGCWSQRSCQDRTGACPSTPKGFSPRQSARTRVRSETSGCARS